MRYIADRLLILIGVFSQQVFDKDTFSRDDKMGDAEIDIHPFVEATKMNLSNIPDGTVITTVKPNRHNCLADESAIVWKDGTIVQDIIVRLKNVESGELELQLSWIDLSKASGSRAAWFCEWCNTFVFLPHSIGTVFESIR